MNAAREPLEPEIEQVVGCREREPRPACATRAEALAGRDRDAMLLEQVIAGDAVGQAEPDEERALAPRVDSGERGQRAVAPALVDRATFLDRVLRPGQRCDPRLLHRPEDAGEDVILQHLDARDELCVADREAEPPPRHAVASSTSEQLDADVARAVHREKALRAPAVEDEIAVGEVVQHPRARAVGPRDRLFEHAVGDGMPRRVRRDS